MSQQRPEPTARVSGYHVPAALKEYDVWVLWVPGWDKTARAPWEEGHMYPCEWSASKPVDPRRGYNKAAAAASLPVDEIDRLWPFPNDRLLPDEVKPAVLLPPEHVCCDLAFVDFDDVRDPETGAVSVEVWDLVNRLNGYTEVSRSGEGLHVYVLGSLPPGVGKFIEELDGPGHVEVYDHGRMTGGTWRHVFGTPADEINQAQDVLEYIFETYRTDPQPPEPSDNPTHSETPRSLSRNGQADRSPYYDQLSLKSVADRGPFRHYRTDPHNPARDDWQGPHPAHGGTSSSDRESTNFVIDNGLWHCFADDDGGGPLELIAVIEGVVSCGKSGQIHDHPELLLRTCLYARDEYGVPDDDKPPYAALWAVAEHADLAVKDRDRRILGSDAYCLAEQIYENMTVSDL